MHDPCETAKFLGVEDKAIHAEDVEAKECPCDCGCGCYRPRDGDTPSLGAEVAAECERRRAVIDRVNRDVARLTGRE